MISAGSIVAMVGFLAGMLVLDRLEMRYPPLRRRREW